MPKKLDANDAHALVSFARQKLEFLDRAAHALAEDASAMNPEELHGLGSIIREICESLEPVEGFIEECHEKLAGAARKDEELAHA
jgi:hypothetical protein